MNQRETYESAGIFASELLAFHDASFLHRTAACYDEDETHRLMAARVLMRALLPRFTAAAEPPNDRFGPFLLQLTGLHASNILVDDDWNITCLIDLEWVRALPAGRLGVPYWLASCGIDQIHDGRLTEFDESAVNLSRS